MKRQTVRNLLISRDPAYRWAVTDRRIDWVTDRFVLARRDLFSRDPAPRLTLKTTTVRRVLDSARQLPLLDGRIAAIQTVKGADGVSCILLSWRYQ